MVGCFFEKKLNRNRRTSKTPDKAEKSAPAPLVCGTGGAWESLPYGLVPNVSFQVLQGGFFFTSFVWENLTLAVWFFIK
jgi:hypothetical protein